MRTVWLVCAMNIERSSYGNEYDKSDRDMSLRHRHI